jgi:hypothetical protein
MTRALRLERRIDARPETVFSYLTDPRRYMRWMGVDAQLDPQPGGIYRVTVPQGFVALGEFVEIDPPHRVDTEAMCEQRFFRGDLDHQLVDIFELLQRRPAGIARPPVRTRPQPYRKGLGEILVRMALRIPEPKVLDIAPAGRIGAVVERIVFRRRAEQLLPAAAALQLVSVLHGVARFVTKNGHALPPGTALDLEHHFLLELHQAGMGEVERDGNAGSICRTEPFARYPYVWPQPDAPLFELFIKSADTILEPNAFDRNPQTTEALLEQLLIR